MVYGISSAKMVKADRIFLDLNNPNIRHLTIKTKRLIIYVVRREF